METAYEISDEGMLPRNVFKVRMRSGGPSRRLSVADIANVTPAYLRPYSGQHVHGLVGTRTCLSAKTSGPRQKPARFTEGMVTIISPGTNKAYSDSQQKFEGNDSDEQIDMHVSVRPNNGHGTASNQAVFRSRAFTNTVVGHKVRTVYREQQTKYGPITVLEQCPDSSKSSSDEYYLDDAGPLFNWHESYVTKEAPATPHVSPSPDRPERPDRPSDRPSDRSSDKPPDIPPYRPADRPAANVDSDSRRVMDIIQRRTVTSPYYKDRRPNANVRADADETKDVHDARSTLTCTFPTLTKDVLSSFSAPLRGQDRVHDWLAQCEDSDKPALLPPYLPAIRSRRRPSYALV